MAGWSGHATISSTSTGSVSLVGGTGQVNASFIMSNLNVTGGAGALNLSQSGSYTGSSSNITGGSGALSFVGTGSNYQVQIYGSTVGSTTVDLTSTHDYYEYFYSRGSGLISYRGGAQYNGYFYAQSDSYWHDGNVVIAGSAGYNQFTYSGSSANTVDLTKSTVTGWQAMTLNGDTFVVNSAELAKTTTLNGNGTLTTNDATLDLSAVSSDSMLIKSNNATGTTFTVSSATIGLNVLGGTGSDTLVGKNFAFSADQRAEIFATASVEKIVDTSGTYGNNAGQTLTARPTGDTVVGGSGADHILAGSGNDVLTGNSGNDVFDFSTLGTHFGKDVVTDFIPGADSLQLSSAAFVSGADVLAHSAQVGNNAVIVLDSGNSITLNGVALSNLHASDFYVI